MVRENKKVCKDQKPLNIGINITSAVAGGGVTYLENLIKWMSACYGSNRYYIYSKRESAVRRFDSMQSNCKWIECWFFIHFSSLLGCFGNNLFFLCT